MLLTSKAVAKNTAGNVKLLDEIEASNDESTKTSAKYTACLWSQTR